MTGRRCRPRVPGAVLPGRTEVLVERERRTYPEAVADVVYDRINSDRVIEVDPEQESGREPEVLDEQILAVLRSDVQARVAAAAFVAGRCTTGDDAADATIRAGVQAVVDAIDPTERLGRNARPYVEAVMALALLGDVDGARQRFEAMLTGSMQSIADHLAAGYLAQLGDPVGYLRLIDDLRDRDSAQVRGVAVDQLIAFVSYDGQRVGDTVVDVRGELRRSLRDRDSDVGIDAVAAIIESGLPDAATLLEEATGRPHAKAVRQAAAEALKHLPERA